MKKLHLFILLLLPCCIYAQDSTYFKYNILIHNAEELYNQKNYKQSLIFYDRAFSIIDFVPSQYFNAFTVAISDSNYSKANEYLLKGALKGFDYSKWNSPETELFNKTEYARHYGTVKDSLLTLHNKSIDLKYFDTLKKMEILDQSVRFWESKQMMINDSINFDKLIDLSKVYGFPTYKKTGYGHHVATLILFHNADKYPNSNQWQQIIPYINQAIFEGTMDPNFYNDFEIVNKRWHDGLAK